jgi:hypothetical protein
LGKKSLIFLLVVPYPDGARRRVIEEETQNMLEERGEEWLYQKAFSDPHCPSALESKVSKPREQVAERRRATLLTVGDHAGLGQNKAAHVKEETNEKTNPFHSGCR